jgi:microsomal dipeptidase-like Zn-dependent dipeptidase
MKPFGKSFKYKPTKQNELSSGRKNSIWHYSPPNFLERQVSKILTLTKFTQTDLTALAKFNCEVIVVALYPFEKHFIKKKMLGFKFIADLLVNLAAGISQKRVDYIRSHSSYFKDLNDEYQYYLQQNNFAQKINNITFTYRLVNSYDEIENNINDSTDTRKIISIVPTIEGCHAFETGLDLKKNMANETTVLNNIDIVKQQWKHTPFFVTLAHHFYNEICGHARSINIGAIKKNQDREINTDITDLGFKVIDKLLNKNNGKRILIDVKHMSTASRKTYYKELETTYVGEKIPIIVSHGAVNGKRSIVEWDKKDSSRSKHFSDIDINFYDSEIQRIAKSKGIFGIQLDERRIGSKKAIRNSRIYFPNRKRRLKKKALLVWRQIEHCAELINAIGLNCWETVAIGSDFDGIINPIKGLWTSENINALRKPLIHHAEEYMKKNAQNLLPQNRISAEEIVDSFLFKNAKNFLKENFKAPSPLIV